jgi:hypothetical protein
MIIVRICAKLSEVLSVHFVPNRRAVPIHSRMSESTLVARIAWLWKGVLG